MCNSHPLLYLALVDFYETRESIVKKKEFFNQYDHDIKLDWNF
jgi:hypothetical protein